MIFSLIVLRKYRFYGIEIIAYSDKKKFFQCNIIKNFGEKWFLHCKNNTLSAKSKSQPINNK